MGLKVKQVDGLQSALDAKLAANGEIPGATKTKITYDAKGLVTAGADLAASDLPTGIDAAKIANGNVSNTEFQYLDGVTSAIQTQIENKVTKNANITAGTYPKVTVDVKGLVTAGASLAEADIPTLAQSKITNLTTDLAAKATKISGGTNGNIVTRDASGNIADSGKKFDDNGSTTNDIWSASKIASAISAGFATNDAMIYKGPIDCSSNPNYPAGQAGDTYKVSVAGKIGGASGVNVEVGDMIICNVDETISGTHASVGSSWNIIQVNLDGAVIGPASVTNEKIAVFDGISGKLLKAASKTISEIYTDLTVDETVLLLTVPAGSYPANNIHTFSNFFSTLPATNCKPIIMINGLMIFNRSTVTFSDAWERNGADLKVKLPYALDTSDEIQAIIATK